MPTSRRSQWDELEPPAAPAHSAAQSSRIPRGPCFRLLGVSWAFVFCGDHMTKTAPPIPAPDHPFVPTTKPILTVDEVAALLQVERRQVDRLGVPKLRLGRKTVRYSARAVMAWLESRAAAA